MALMGIHANLQVVVIPQRSLSYNLFHLGCVLLESRWVRALQHVLNIKSLKAMLTIQLTPPINLSCHAFLFLSVHNPTRYTLGQIKHLQILQVETRKFLNVSITYTTEYHFQTDLVLNIQRELHFTHMGGPVKLVLKYTLKSPSRVFFKKEGK